jgi:hypothetical protein
MSEAPVKLEAFGGTALLVPNGDRMECLWIEGTALLKPENQPKGVDPDLDDDLDVSFAAKLCGFNS